MAITRRQFVTRSAAAVSAVGMPMVVSSRVLGRFADHLQANDIDINTATLGPWLEVDRERERFHNHDEANRIVQGFYREPYVTPELI